MLPNTAGRFGLIQVTDAYGKPGTGLDSQQIQAEAPHFDSVWGTFSPSTWNGSHPGMILSRYYVMNEDATLMSGHDLTWFQTNHPDWILYGCDNNNNPTTHYAYAYTGFKDVPLNIHNPAVVQYQLANILQYLRANGYNALALDNLNLSLYVTSPNPVLEGQKAQAGWYGCGVYTKGVSNPGSFQRVYNGPLNSADPTYVADVQNWLAQARSTLRPYGIKIIVNHDPFDSSPNSAENQMLGSIDGMLDENGFTHYGTLLTGAQYNNTLNWMEILQSRGLAVFITDYFCTGSSCSHDPGSLSAQQVDWALASYAIGNNGGANVYISPAGGAIYTYRPEYSTRYGAACGAYSQSGGAYTRRFAGGFAVVNAGGSAQKVTLPNHTYTDIEGRAVSNPLTVNGTDAYMLLTSSNGCS